MLIWTASAVGLLLAGVAVLVYSLGGSASLHTAPLPPPVVEASVQPLDQTAEEKAYEAIRKVPRAPETAESPSDAEQGKSAATQRRTHLADGSKHRVDEALLPPTTLALNCERLRKAYSHEELDKIPGFKEKCTE
jgi:hypothetical protein